MKSKNCTQYIAQQQSETRQNITLASCKARANQQSTIIWKQQKSDKEDFNVNSRLFLVAVISY
jgi:hypothetical protein